MTYLHRLFGSKSRRQPKPLEQKPRKHHQLHIEELEARITPADVTVASLLFRGDLVADGALWRATGKPIEVGFKPTGGEAFKSLVTLTGDTVIDPALQNFQFQGTGALAGASGQRDFWSSTTLSTFDVQRMTTATGESITGKALTLGDLVTTATTLALENPNGGDTTDSQLKLDGAGTLAFAGAATPLSINPLALTVTGAAAGTATGKATGSFQAQGTTWTLTQNPLSATITAGKSTVTVTGTATALLRTDTLSVDMTPSKDAATGLVSDAGLVIEAGAIKTLVASTINQNFTVAGTPITLNGKFSFSNSALGFKGTAQHTGVLAFLTYSDFSFGVQDNKLTDLAAYATQPWLNAAAGGVATYFSLLPFKGAVSVSSKMETKLSTDTSGKESLSITGSAGFNYDWNKNQDAKTSNEAMLTLTAAGNGFVIRDGKLQDWDVQLDGRLDLIISNKVNEAKPGSFEAKATRLWYSANDPTFGKDTYGFSGSVYLAMDGVRSFGIIDPNKDPNKPDSKIPIVREPSNFFELNCGTREQPGFVLADGQVRRIDVALSLKKMEGETIKAEEFLDIHKLKFRIQQVGLYYNATDTEKVLGFYGTVSTNFGFNKEKGIDGKYFTASLGTRENPGLQLISSYDPDQKAWIATWSIRDIFLRFPDFRIGIVGFKNVEMFYRVDKNNPNLSVWGGRLEVAVKYFYVGGKFELKSVKNEQGEVTAVLFNGASLSASIDPNGLTPGLFPALSAKGLHIIAIEVGVENWQDPSNWNWYGTATIGVGPRLPWFDTDNKVARNVYTLVGRGTLRYYPSAGRISGEIDVFVAAYWDASAYSVNLEGWKDLLGNGRGTFIIDWENDFYRFDVNCTIFDLIHGQLQFQLSKGELVLYAFVRLSPVPGSTFDFWPINKIDISVHILLILAKRHRLFAGWANIKIIFIDATVGFGYDFIKKDGFWILGEGKVNELIKLKDSYLNSEDKKVFRYGQTFETEVASTDATGLHSSSYTVSIPFLTTSLYGTDFTYAKMLEKDDFNIEFNNIPEGVSASWAVNLGDIEKTAEGRPFRTGSIRVRFLPFLNGKIDYSKTFASLGLTNLKIEIKVRHKQNSMFFNHGLDEEERKVFALLLELYWPAFMKEIDTTKSGAEAYAPAFLDRSKELLLNLPAYNYYSTKKVPIGPTQFDSFLVAQPTIEVPQPAPFDDNTTNLVSFTAHANASPKTRDDGTVSLLIAEEAEIAANRWTVQRTGPWRTRPQNQGYANFEIYDTNYAYAASGWVVERNTFDQIEIRDQKVDTPYAGTVGSEVLFFDSARATRVGVVSGFGTNGATVQIVANGVTLSVAANQVKDLWARKAEVQLLANSNAGNIGDVFTATNNTKGFTLDQVILPDSYYEAFSLDQQVVLGVMPPLPTGEKITPQMLKLPTLPNFVTNQKALTPAYDVAYFYPLDQSTGLTVLKTGANVSLSDASGAPTQDVASADLKNLTYANGQFSGQFRWTEKGLIPTPKYAYLVVNDAINPATFGDFYRFVPSVQMMGKAWVTDNANPQKPYEGLTVFIDANGNGKFDQEPFNDANGDGQFNPGPGDPFTDLNGNGRRDGAEPFVDGNNNQQFDPDETYRDVGNGQYDGGEPFVDANNNQRFDPDESYLDVGNGRFDEGESFQDANANNQWDPGEQFQDRGNGSYDGPEPFVDANNNKQWDPGEQYQDLGNGRYDGAEPFVDANNNGQFDPKENFFDSDGDGVRDDIFEMSTITNAAGEYFFYGLGPGTYRVGFVLPDNRLPVSGTSFLTVTRGTEPTTTAPDFVAKWANPTLTGQVFVDTNQNNLRDPGEVGAAGARLVLTDKNNTPINGANGLPLVVFTDDDGNYSVTLGEKYGTEVRLKLDGTTDSGGVAITPTQAGGDNKLFSGISYANPANLNHQFAVQADIRFVPDSNASLLQNLTSYLMLFLNGKYSEVSLVTSGFEFHVDRFKFLRGDRNEQGLETAKGRAVFGGQTLNFEFVGPRGLVVNAGKLKEVNLKLSGNFTIFGASLDLTQLTGRFVAGDPAQGTSDRFELTGSTELEIGGHKVTAQLLNTGLVLSDRGIESLDLKFTGALRIAGQDVDLGSLGADYDRVADKLTLSGDTKILTLGSETEGVFFRLRRALIEITGGKVTTLQATVEGAMNIAGAKFSLDSLSFAYIASPESIRLTGSSTVQFAGDRFTVSLPEPGAEFTDDSTTVKGKVTGTATLGTKASPVTLSLDNLDLDYSEADRSLRIAGKTRVTVNKVQVALAQGDLRFSDGQFQSLKASASGEFTVGGAVVTLGAGNQFEYDRATSLVGLKGDATLSLAPAADAKGENNQKTTLVTVNGSIRLKDDAVEAITATVSTGTLRIAGAPVQIQSMAFAYDSAADRYTLGGSAWVELLGGKLTAAFPSPGIVWKNGRFDSLSFNLSGELPLQKDKAGNPAIALKIEDLAAAYSDSAGTLTLTGGASIRAGNTYGKFETDPAGIVIADNQLRNFSAFLTLNLGFGGEAFTDTNQNLKWDSGEPFTDANANKKYDVGLSLDVTRAGVSYTAATADSGARLLLAGKAVLDFDGTEPGGEGVSIEMASPGIELVDGEVENFSAAVTAAFDLKSLRFQPSGAAGLRYQRARAQLDLFSAVEIKVGANAFGFTLGTSFDKPGLRLEYGAITYASASLSADFGIGDLKLEAENAGFTFDSENNSWAIYGSAKITNIFSVAVGLGTADNPGLLIRDNDWSINKLTIALSSINLGAFSLDDGLLTIDRLDKAWSVYAACSVRLPIGTGISASGEFSLVAGKVDLISVALASSTGINIPNTPLFINYLAGGIRNLSNLSQITLTGSIGVGLGTTVNILGKDAITAQFVGSFTMDPNSLKIQVDAYLGAVNSGSLTKPVWDGLLAKGTGVMFLDWSRGVYSADLNLSFLKGTFVSRGTLYFSQADGMVLSSTANLSVPKEVPIIGGLSLASANFLFVYNPAKDRFYAMGWGEVALLGTRGLKYDVLTDSFSVVNEDDIKANLASAATPRAMVLSMPRQDTPFLRSAGVLHSPMGPRFIALGTLDTLDQPWSYSGVSTAIPVTEVSDGTYVARFRVNDPARWAGFNAWRNRMAFEADPVAGVEMSEIPLEFDPATGLGSIGIRVSPLPGQYLPRGLVLRSRLLSPVELTGTLGSGDPDLESGWNQAFAYGGRTPPVGFDKEFNAPPDGLRVRAGRFTVSYRPVVDATGQLPDDWVESLRLYLDPVEGVRFTISAPFFDEKLQQGCMVITATKVDGSYLDNGLRFSGVIRSKVALGNPEDKDGLNQGEVYPLLGIRWETDPPVVDIPAVSPNIASGIQTTTLTGRVNDLRLKEVYVSLFYSTDYEGNEEYIASDPAGNPVESIPVAVNPDGTWSTRVTWDSSGLPSGDLWLYGLVSEGPGRTPVYGESAGPFRVTHSVSGTITDPAGGYSGVPVFADLNGDGSWQTDEPRAISDFGGAYAFDLPAALVSARIVFAIPDYFRPVAGASASKWVDLSGGPVVENLALVPAKTIVRGSAFVTENMVIDQSTGARGRPVSGLSVILTGPGGIILRATTNNIGRYEIPVEVAGDYALTLDVVNSAYLGFQLAELSQTPLVRHIAIPQNAPGIVKMDPVHVDSIGLVNTFAPRGMGSLASLVDLSDEGYVSTIRFDASMRGATIDISLPDNSPAKPYYLWDSASDQWILVSPPVAEELRYGDTAFILSSDLRIDGGDLGITLREAAAADDPNAGYRAFYVQPGVRFLLENITIQGFTSKGQPGNPGVTGESTVSGGGAAGGGGGAILNRGATTLNNVHLINNTALGGRGGDAPVPIYLVQPDNPGQAGLPLGTNGNSQKGGNGGGYKGGIGGQAFPVTITYTLGNDPTPLTATVMIAGAGGGGAGLGGAIYNGKGASLTIGGGSTFTGNSASGGKGGVGSPEFITNLANVLFGDSARTLSVTGFEAWELSQGNDGAGLGGAIYNNGGTVRVADSVFSGNFSTDAGAALYSTKGSTVINTSAFRDNSSGQDQGIRFEGGDITQGVFELNRSMVLAGGNDPRALVATGGRRFGEGNIVSSQTGFAWGVLASAVVARPDSPFTGKPYIPASDGAPVAFGAPVTFTTDTRVRAAVRQPFYITTTVSNPAGVGVPGGRVVLGLAGLPVAEGRLNADGSVSVAAPGLKAGRYSFDVYYEGDSIFAGGLGKTSVTVGSTTERIVEELYETHLGRESDASGLKAWSARIDGGLSVEEAVRAFRSSTEAGLKTVERVYQDLLNRLPDQVGRDNWLRFLQTGKTERDLRAQVLASREYTGGHTREEVINRLYETYLGREADSAGMANWLARWDAGVDAGTIARAIGSSNEAREVVVDELYQQILAREADQVGRKAWAGALANGMSKDQFEVKLLQSREFMDGNP